MLYHFPYLATVYKRQASQECSKTSAHKILRIPPWSLETNISDTLQTKIEKDFFPLHGYKDLPKSVMLLFLNWKTCMLPTFLLTISLSNSCFIPKPKSSLLTSFQFVLSATSSFISKLAVLALSSTSFLKNVARNDLRSVSRLSAREGAISLSVWYRTSKEFSVLVMPSKNCNFSGTSESFWIEQRWSQLVFAAIFPLPGFLGRPFQKSMISKLFGP